MIPTSVTLPENLINESKQYSDNFSQFVSNALVEYLKKQKIEKALESFGKWQDRGVDSSDIVNELRKDRDLRHYPDGNVIVPF
ncbi:MAG: type II toxin-antitoxin system CcdA family antitoxin [Nitrospirae bacterium]|nr:type II toxin-antitoxin system CcdA family antitoxin [Nitrospirota bacterium]MBF0535685.1 type II toxin-antitoxin system CcdA family antitoxin [Nitrospirota bacterium]MBF0617510.1 type II toxin-antitoxin system CcdA family antitoxin [Nitrospirota bacterium]